MLNPPRSFQVTWLGERRLNRILPPDTHPYDMRIPNCYIHACVCDLSKHCVIRECAFFNVDPEMTELAKNTMIGFHNGTVNEEKHYKQMKKIWDRETKKNFYTIYGDKPVCNEPVVSKQELEYLVKYDCIDTVFNDDGSTRLMINWDKYTKLGWMELLRASQKMINDIDDE